METEIINISNNQSNTPNNIQTGGKMYNKLTNNINLLKLKITKKKLQTQLHKTKNKKKNSKLTKNKLRKNKKRTKQRQNN